MKRSLIGGIAVAVIGTLTYGLIQWQTTENQKRDALCEVARQSLKDVETRARASAAGLSVDAYAKAEEAEVAALISALDATTNDAEVEAVIESHSAAVEAQGAASDAAIETRGDQKFLEQRRMKQQIPVDVKQELQRAAKAVNVACG